MRKSIIFITLAAALCASCVKSETDGSNIISFSPVASKATKAIIDGTTFPDTVSFAVSAYRDGSEAYFEGLTASYALQDTLWETSPSQYWPLGGSLTFHAYSPANADSVSIDASGVTATGYTVQTAGQMTTDLCYATAFVADCASHPDAVRLVFSHALSQIVFKVKAAANYSTSGSTISLAMTSLSLSDINSKGDLAEGRWDNQRAPHSYDLADTVALTYNAQNAADTLIVCKNLSIPQEIGADARLNVGYSISQNISGTEYKVDNPPVSIPLRSTVTEWQPGKKYIYLLSIGLDNLITFTASAADWTAQEGGVVVE